MCHAESLLKFNIAPDISLIVHIAFCSKHLLIYSCYKTDDKQLLQHGLAASMHVAYVAIIILLCTKYNWPLIGVAT